MITTGSITQKDTKGRTWQITIELPQDPISGKRIRRYKTVEGTQKEAERAMHEYIRELEKGYHITNKRYYSRLRYVHRRLCILRLYKYSNPVDWKFGYIYRSIRVLRLQTG